MYAVQVQNYDGYWVTVGEPTPSYSRAKQEADSLGLGDTVRVACVDSAANPS